MAQNQQKRQSDEKQTEDHVSKEMAKRRARARMLKEKNRARSINK